METKNRKLVSLDLDGTLLNSQSEISEYTKQYLKEIQKDGVLVCLSSGRPYRALTKFYNQLELQTPVICYNGALCFDPQRKDFPKTNFMFRKEELKEILKEVGEERFENIYCEDMTKSFLLREDYELSDWLHFKDMEIVHGSIIENLDRNVYICIMNTGGDSKLIEDLLETTARHDSIGVRFWSGCNYCEFYYKAVSKYSALQSIMKYYDIDENNVYFFGDAENDIEMFNNVKNSVCMINGNKEFHKEAKMVSVADNNNDGVAKTLQQLLNI